MAFSARSLAILTALALGLPTATAWGQAEYEEERSSFPQRLENLGRSLVGGNKSSGQRPTNQRPARNAAIPQRSADPYYDTAFGDDEVANRQRPANGQSAMRQGQSSQPPAQQQAPQQHSNRRAQTNEPRTPVASSPSRSAPAQQPTSASPKNAGPNDNIPRTARASQPGKPEREVTAAPAATPEPVEAVVRQTSPSIAIETIGPRKISVGKQSTYKLVLKNSGTMAAHDVVVTVAIPEFAEVVDAKPTTGATEPAPGQEGLCWKLNTVASQGREELTIDIIPRKSQAFDLGVRWTQAPVTSQTSVEVQEPKLALAMDGVKEVPFGERAVYKLLLSNPGTGDAENVVITLMPLNAADGPPASHALGTMHPGESKTIEVELIARQVGHITIQAEAKASGDIKASLAEEVLVRRAALTVTAHGPKMVYSGTPANYEVRVKNTGNAAAQNLRVACKLPRQAEYSSCNASGQHSADDNAVLWTIASLDADAEITLSAKCMLHAPGSNQVEVSCVGDRDLQQATSLSTQVEAVADLAMEVIDPSGPVSVDSEMTYEIHIKNRGSKTAEAIDVVTYFSNGIEPVSVDGGSHELKPGMVVFRSIPSLEPGREVVYKVKARAETAGTHRCRVELNCKPLDTKLTEEETTLFYSESETPAQ